MTGINKDIIMVPRTQGQLVDLLGAMILSAPEFKALYANWNIEIAFFELHSGIDNFKKKFTEKGCADLHAMADEAERLYRSGAHLLEPNTILMNMQKYIWRKKWLDDELGDPKDW